MLRGGGGLGAGLGTGLGSAAAGSGLVSASAGLGPNEANCSNSLGGEKDVQHVPRHASEWTLPKC